MTDGPTRPSRATRMAAALKGTGEHRYTEGAFAMLGLILLGADLYTMLQHPPSGIGDQVFHGLWALIAIAFIPGAAARVIRFAKGLNDAWKAWKGGTP